MKNIKEKILECGCHKVNIEGNVFSQWRQFSKKGKEGIQTERTKEWRRLKLTITPLGYLQVSIHGKLWRIHRLIATVFILNSRNYKECHHKNDIKTDNRINNLEWGNAKQNAFDRAKNGHLQQGSKHYSAKLNMEKVKEIRILRNSYTLKELAKKYKVSINAIESIVQRKTWKSVI